ncbi:MAG: hypothetical protein E6Q98_12320 [Rhodospirillaceae bacterium]|nr:MAG: hypothetical protein E6Q98_12320 [Rhodospirillaceae bacterium]
MSTAASYRQMTPMTTVLLVMLLGITYLTLSYFFHLHEELAQLGDFVGGAVGAISVIIVVCSLREQRAQIAQQREADHESLRLQQVEISRQKLSDQAILALELMKINAPQLQQLSRRIAEKGRLVVYQRMNGTPGKLAEYLERFKDGEKDIFFERIQDAHGQMSDFIKNNALASQNGASRKDAAAAIYAIDQFIAAVQPISDLASADDPIGKSVRATLPLRVFDLLADLSSDPERCADQFSEIRRRRQEAAMRSEAEIAA